MNDRVRDWMTRDPDCVREDVSALDAFDRMVDRGIRHLPVVDSERRVIGILSVDDLRGALPFEVSMLRPIGVEERREAEGYRVSDAMTWAPQTSRSDDALAQAARAMAEHRIGCLPVVDECGRLEGILSETDALRALYAPPQRESVRPPPAGGADAMIDSLFAERERIFEQLANWRHAERRLPADPNGEPGDGGERGDPVRARASRRLRAIDEALERTRSGRFGICERCQGRIPATRLRALPEATLCVRCARVAARASGGP